MKKVSAIALLFSFAYLNAVVIDRAKYDERFETLTKPRVGLSKEQIMTLKDPFYIQRNKSVSIEQVVEEDTMGYKLNGIMDNKAKINSKWYDLGDYIGSYKLVQINENSIIIANDNNKKVEIKMSQGSRNVIITYK